MQLVKWKAVSFFGFPMVLSWFLLVRMENKLAGLTDVIGELSCNIAAMRGDVVKK